MQNINTLGDWIRSKMQEYHFSAREFADFTGLSRQVVNNILSEKEGYTPSVDTFVKLARATKTDIMSLFALCIPEDLRRETPASMILSQQIERLPAHYRDMIDALIIGAALKERNKPSE